MTATEAYDHYVKAVNECWAVDNAVKWARVDVKNYLGMYGNRCKFRTYLRLLEDALDEQFGVA